jgi:hypothetical protein
MAPEQLRGEAVDARSDQWSFCVTAVEAFTGQRPFVAESREELLEATLARPSDAAFAGVPPGVISILRRGLEPEPSARFASMDALLERLELARETPGSARATRWLGVAAAALAAAVAIVFVVRRAREEPPPAVSAPAPLATPSASALAPIADITRLCRSVVRASSERAAHPALHAFDGIPATAWTEADDGNGTGQWVEAELVPGTWVSSVEVSGGWSAKTASGVDLWEHNTTFRRMRVSWDGGEQELTFERARDRGKRRRVVVEAPTRSIRITALEVDRGRFHDLCLDEVVIHGRCAPQ